MNDLVSRQALLDKFEQWQKTDGYSNGEWNLLVDVITEIKNMPLATDINVATKQGADCISRHAAIEALRDYLAGERCPDDGTLTCRLIENEAINKLPIIQPEIIRCKDCKYARLTYDGSCKYCDIWFPDEAEYMDGDYYCASAERKSNG